MCTLIVARDLAERETATDEDSTVQVWVGANRDEALDRPSKPPSIRRANDVRILAPTDERAGGTWLGINEHGVFAGLTNRYGSPYDPERRSRGELVLRALSRASASEAAQQIGALDGDDYNGFHLICADSTSMHLVWGGSGRIVRAPVESRIAVITERSLGATDDARKRQTKRRIERVRSAGEFGSDWLKAILADAGDGASDATGLDVPATGSSHSLCICPDQGNYGTRSSTVLALGHEPRGWHAEGPPCRVDYEEITDQVRDVWLSR